MNANEAAALRLLGTKLLACAEIITTDEKPAERPFTIACAEISAAINCCVRLGMVDAGAHDVIVGERLIQFAPSVGVVL